MVNFSEWPWEGWGRDGEGRVMGKPVCVEAHLLPRW